MDLKLLSTVVCDDVLRNPSDWLSLYSLFREVHADVYPTTLVRMHVVATWLYKSARVESVIQRVAVRPRSAPVPPRLAGPTAVNKRPAVTRRMTRPTSKRRMSQ